MKASEEAIAFLSSIGEFLSKCVFSDSLVTVSESGRDLGNFTVTVEFARKGRQPCMLLHAQSQGAIDESPCGTTLEVLEEHHHEYVKLEGHSLDKKCHMVQHNGQMVINKITTVGEVKGINSLHFRIKSVSYPLPVLRGHVTEGSNLLLMRLIALRKKVPDVTFISLDQGLHIIHSTFVSDCQLEVGGETVEVFGVERIVRSAENPTTWQSYFLVDGHLAGRAQVGSPVTTRLLHLPSQLEEGNHSPTWKTPLIWEKDMQMHSNFLDRKEELKEDHALYLRENPEISALISDFLHFLLLRKPDDVFQFARDYFLPFAAHSHPEPPSKQPLGHITRA
uniref:Ciliogenesis-associated TTC17-interacting protein n=1 Tax=Mola mola TaxID=94237 RepID=A0A3Q3XI39_MOLML